MSAMTTSERSNTTTQPTPPSRKRNSLAKGKLPKWAIPAIAGGSIILGAAGSTLTGFNVASFAIYSAVIFLIAASVATTVVEGKRRGKNATWTYLIYASFILALIPLASVLYTVLEKGLPGMNMHFLFSSMNGVTGAVDNQTVENGTPVLGGAGIVLFGSVAAAGIRTLAKAKDDNMNMLIIATSLAFGCIPMVKPDFYEHFPTWVGTIFQSSISSATIMAVLLNIIFNELTWRKKEDSGRTVYKYQLTGLQDGDRLIDGKLYDNKGLEIKVIADEQGEAGDRPMPL